jgi:hypothetical protein
MGVMRRHIAFANDFSLVPTLESGWKLLRARIFADKCSSMQDLIGSGGEWIPMPARMVRHDLTKANLISIRVDILGINIQR